MKLTKSIGIAVVSENLLNRLLDDDIVDKGYVSSTPQKREPAGPLADLEIT